MKAIILALSVAAGLTQEPPPITGKVTHPIYITPAPPLPPQHVLLFRWSQAAFSAATIFDAASSHGLVESNPLARSANGKFGAQGWSFAAGQIVFAWLGESWVVRKWPKMRVVFVGFNFSAAAGHAAWGVHNLGVR